MLYAAFLTPILLIRHVSVCLQDRQASARAHRIGQTKPVVVYRLVAEGTCEERIVAIANEKLCMENIAINDIKKANEPRLTLDGAWYDPALTLNTNRPHTLLYKILANPTVQTCEKLPLLAPPICLSGTPTAPAEAVEAAATVLVLFLA